MTTYFITGATSGLGYQVALCLARIGGHHLVLPARDTLKAKKFRTELVGLGAAEVSIFELDLSSLKGVATFLKDFQRNTAYQLDGVLLNAGRQSASRLAYTSDGFEATFAVNHLAHYLLLKSLMSRLSANATVGWTASDTHDPAKKLTRLFGFRGSQYTTAARIAAGDYADASAVQACRDAYATSKLCNIVTARTFAKDATTTKNYFSFEPGLMPGTGLAREQGTVMFWVWKNVLPLLSRLLPGTSSTEQSAAVLTDLLVGSRRGSYNGAYFNYTGKQFEPAILAKEQWVADDLCLTSDTLLARFV